MKRKLCAILLCAAMLFAFSACGGKGSKAIAYWKADSPGMASLVSFVHAVSDERSESFVPEEERIAVFDMDGTLYGERFPTYLRRPAVRWGLRRSPCATSLKRSTRLTL